MSTGIRLNWLDYIDEDSFVDFFLVIELTKNPDGYRGSCYFHKVRIVRLIFKMFYVISDQD